MQCDDANVKDGDGCSSLCTIEAGFECTGGNRFTYDICTATGVAGARRRNASVPHRGGAERKLLASSVRIAVRMGRGKDEAKGGALMVEKYLWAVRDARCEGLPSPP